MITKLGLRAVIANMMVRWVAFWQRNYDPLGPADVIVRQAVRRAKWEKT